MVNISGYKSKAPQILGILASLVVLPALPLLALPPTAANDGTRTIVTPNNNTFDITGGTRSGDRSNLFHSFNQFNLERNQVANFISQPGINNILGRVVGGNPSLINGLIQVTNGNSNLFLINPAGIVFGQNASLNVPASFTATTALAIGFGNNNLFTALGNNDYANLNGNPNYFIVSPLGMVNDNNLVVNSNQNFPLLRETTGDISQLGGRVDRVFRLSKPGNILSLEVNATELCQQVRGCPNGMLPDNWLLPAVELPRLLTLGVAALGVNPPNSPLPPANGLANSPAPNSPQPINPLQGQNLQNPSSALRVVLTGNSSPNQQPREPSIGNAPLPTGTTSVNASGGALPRYRYPFSVRKFCATGRRSSSYQSPGTFYS